MNTTATLDVDKWRGDTIESENVVRERRISTPRIIVIVGERSTPSTSTTSTSTRTETSTVAPDSGSDVPIFLEMVYSLSAQGKTRAAMDIVFRRINYLLNAGDFRACDDILAQVEVDRLSSTVLVGFLSITLSASRVLVARPLFFSRVRAKVLTQKGPAATATLLDKYNGR
jgi:hypothetical protein